MGRGKKRALLRGLLFKRLANRFKTKQVTKACAGKGLQSETKSSVEVRYTEYELCNEPKPTSLLFVILKRNSEPGYRNFTMGFVWLTKLLV